jgi:CHAT domain-containing protein/Tfp pilus assembly protein PilF
MSEEPFDLLRSLPQPEQEALLACAIPERIDPPLLAALLHSPVDQAVDLLSALHQRRILEAGAHSGYRLPSKLRGALLDHLLETEGETYARLQRRAYDYCTSLGEADESARMAHLEELFYYYLDLNQLPELDHLLDEAARTPPAQPRHRHLLLFYQAVSHGEQQRFDQAETCFQQILADPQVDEELRARVFNSQGVFDDEQGRYDRALARYQESLATYERLGDKDRQGRTLKNISVTWIKLAEYEQALEAAQRSLTLFRELDEPGYIGRSLNELGQIYTAQGHWEEAIACYRESLVIWERSRDARRRGIIYGNLAEVYHYQGKYQDAATYYEKALAIVRQPEIRDRVMETEILCNLGFLHQTQGELGAAGGFYREALALAQEIEHLPFQGQIRYRQGTLHQDRGNTVEAEREYQRSIHLIETMRLGLESEEVKISMVGTWQRVYEAMVLSCLERGDYEQAFHYAERAQSQAFLDLLSRRFPDLLDQLREPVISLEEVQASLPSDAVLLEFFITGVLHQAEDIVSNLPAQAQKLKQYLTAPEKILIFAITRDHIQVRTSPVSPRHFRLRDEFRVLEEDGDPSQPPQVVHPFLQPQFLQGAHTALIEPVWDIAADKRLLYIVPHGPLHYVPFQALRFEDDRPLLHEGGPQFTFGPSATVLFRYCQPRAQAAAEPSLALGYNGAKTILRFAQDEAQDVARLTQGRAVIGAEPKKTLLYKEADRYRMLHFSCHGRFDSNAPLESGLELGLDDTLTMADILKHLRLNAELVTLSACESGVSKIMRGDELVGLSRAFLYAGTPSLICTLWPVDEVSTRILVQKFYQELSAGAGKAQALQRAQIHLQNLAMRDFDDIWLGWAADRLVYARIEAMAKGVKAGTPAGLVEPVDPISGKPFAHPFYWAPFVLVGDPS